MAHHPQFELYAFWRTSATFRVRVALNLKGFTAREHVVDIDAGKQRGEAFLKINPLGAIPALVETGQIPLTQSSAILEYLDEIQPLPPLLPGSAHDRARIRAIAAMLTADTHPFITPRVRKYLTSTGGFDDAAFRTWQVHWLQTGLTAVEQRLANEPGTGRFCHGDQPTIADICLASIIAVMRVFKISVPGTPTIDRIMVACDAQEAFAKAEPYKQEGAPRS